MRTLNKKNILKRDKDLPEKEDRRVSWLSPTYAEPSKNKC